MDVSGYLTAKCTEDLQIDERKGRGGFKRKLVESDKKIFAPFALTDMQILCELCGKKIAVKATT
ncbi:hypothetical protein BC343_03075 [Mucilaginibacter pedocola]|uniref:Uncharacterized protein n=1 Tax=Mucilaginibacter pedocola TaxID=1792845 RepID=A0A1S9PN92_9SPHI|nr:hypothetical protein BC343_03075 [Mucilaginibacter pedocola]